MAKVGQQMRKKTSSGKSRAAKDSDNAYMREYRKENPEKIKEINKRYSEKRAKGKK